MRQVYINQPLYIHLIDKNMYNLQSGTTLYY